MIDLQTPAGEPPDGIPVLADEIEQFTLDMADWPEDEGHRLPRKMNLSALGYPMDPESRALSFALVRLGQGWVHDDDYTIVDTKENILDGLSSLLVNLADLNMDPANARLHSERNIASVKASLCAFGQHRPAVVQKDGMVIRVGNGMVAAARELGWTQIAAVIVDEDHVQATARAIADNRTAELANWDYEVLGEQLKALQDSEFDLGLTGFQEHEFGPLLEAEWKPPAEEPMPTHDFENKDHEAVAFLADQWELVKAAVEHLREVQGDEDLPANQAIAIICENWHSGITASKAGP